MTEVAQLIEKIKNKYPLGIEQKKIAKAIGVTPQWLSECKKDYTKNLSEDKLDKLRELAK